MLHALSFSGYHQASKILSITTCPGGQMVGNFYLPSLNFTRPQNF